jgi:pimeloyl-ACP methyl ester carboxylesterase
VIVLEHGAWADASSWSSVISQLQLLGFTVYAPPNPLRGLPQDADYLHQFLTQNPALQGQPVILVAHSYGGAVITSAAVGDPEVRALVYVDAFIPDEGDTVASLLSGSCLAGNPADLFNIVPIPGAPGDLDLYLKPSLVPGCFANGLPASQAAVIAATQRPLAASALLLAGLAVVVLAPPGHPAAARRRPGRRDQEDPVRAQQRGAGEHGRTRAADRHDRRLRRRADPGLAV